MRKGPVHPDRTPFTNRLLVFLLTLFGRLGSGARRLGLGFLLARVTLGVGLVLLRLALFDHVVATEEGAAGLFDLALDALDAALDRFLRTALVVPHESPPFRWL